MSQLPDRPGPQLIVKMINDANGTTFTVSDFTFGTPSPSVRPNYDTQIDMTFNSGPRSGVVQRFYYNRLDIVILLGQPGLTFENNGQFNTTTQALTQINTRKNLHLSIDDVEEDTFDLSVLPTVLTITSKPNSLVLRPSGLVQFTVTAVTTPPSADYDFLLDLTYIDQESSDYLSWLAYVNQNRDEEISESFSASDAAYAYRITNDASYKTLALSVMDAYVVTQESAIINELIPSIANNNYSNAAEVLSTLATVTAWCAPSTEQLQRWKIFANRVIDNMWDASNAVWGTTTAAWSGVGSPGSTRYTDACLVTGLWALATDNVTYYTLLTEQKLPPLMTYFSTYNGGGSLEGTGYGVEINRWLYFTMIWSDSGQSGLSAQSNFIDNSITYWTHALLPTLDRFCPIGGLPAGPLPFLTDSNRILMLRAYTLTDNLALKDTASWWLNSTYNGMYQSSNVKFNLMPKGSNLTAPTDLTHYAPDTGDVFARTSWDYNGVFFHFRAGPYSNVRAHQNQGSFVLFKSDFLTVGGNVFTNDPTITSCEFQNVIRFNTALGGTIPQSYGTPTRSVETDPVLGNVKVTADLTPIIDDPTVNAWARSISFKDGVTFVSDAFEVSNGTTGTFQICVRGFPYAPGINDNEVIVGDLEIIVYDPYTPTITATPLSSIDADFIDGYRIDITGGIDRYDIELRSTYHSGTATGDYCRPRFDTHPFDQTVNIGDIATFTVNATGSDEIDDPITYSSEWLDGTDWVATGDASAVYSTTPAVIGDNGRRYRFKATNQNGVTISREARLNINL
jgi:hypothetical protein